MRVKRDAMPVFGGLLARCIVFLHWRKGIGFAEFCIMFIAALKLMHIEN